MMTPRVFSFGKARARVPSVTSGSDGRIRFSRRANDYLKYRPGYPDALAITLRHRIGYSKDFVVADIGSGTGISSRYFLDRGNLVYGIEPNQDMRRVAHEWLGGYSRFHNVAARAESTTLDSHSVDLVVAAHSFHWFDQERARTEFERILRPGKFVILLWNERISEGTPFLAAYERLIYDHAADYRGASKYPELAQDSLQRFFGPELRGTEEFANRQPVDLEGLVGRTLGMLPGIHAERSRHAALLTALKELFEEHAEQDSVAFEYATRLVWGRLGRAN